MLIRGPVKLFGIPVRFDDTSPRASLRLIPNDHPESRFVCDCPVCPCGAPVALLEVCAACRAGRHMDERGVR